MLEKEMLLAKPAGLILFFGRQKKRSVIVWKKWWLFTVMGIVEDRKALIRFFSFWAIDSTYTWGCFHLWNGQWQDVIAARLLGQPTDRGSRLKIETDSFSMSGHPAYLAVGLMQNVFLRILPPNPLFFDAGRIQHSPKVRKNTSLHFEGEYSFR